MLVAYSAERMHALVADVQRYPEFLPWCGGAEVEGGAEGVIPGWRPRAAMRG